MIIKQETGSEAQVIGDIENNKVGIDRQNIDFIATLLTSNLYSNPFESFLRETISNAYDAQVENGNPEHTIYLLIQSENGKERFSVRDYGTGISPERFNTIYNKIGSSTKRMSNDFIGGFGTL
jgi:sensor histidine kinase regulating citrate/malate metabolism